MSRYCGEKHVAEILGAGERWRDVALLGQRSLFSDESIWSTANIEILDDAFKQPSGETDGSFLDKLRSVLSSLPASVKILAAEVMWLLLLCPSNVSTDRKRETIRTIWDWSETKFPEQSRWLTDEVLQGIGSGGPGFSNHRPRELAFCLAVLLSFRKLTQDERTKLLAHSWTFAEWLQQVPDAQARQFRHMLLYLLFPDDFERVFSAGERKAIAEHFAELSRAQVNGLSAVELDKVLRQTRDDLEQKYQTSKLDFYRTPLKELWQSDLTELEAALTADHVKKAIAEIDQEGIPKDAVSSTYDLVQGDKRYPPKLVLSLAFKHVAGKELPRSDFAGGEDTWAFRVLRQLGFSIVPKKFINDLVDRFLAQANGGQDLRTSDYPKDYRGLQVRVGFGQGVFSRVPWIAFLGQGQKVSSGIYPVLLYYREARVLILAYGVSETNAPAIEWNGLDQPRTVAAYLQQEHSRAPERYGDSFVDIAFGVPDGLDLDQLAIRLDRMISSYQVQLQASDVMLPPPEDVPPNTVEVDDAIKDLFVSKDRFDRLLDQLSKKKNIILQGPPGVGKTFFAQRLAQVFARSDDPARVRIVQFHASYAYEDFVQGYRPDGKGGFERRDGIFVRACQLARDDPGQPYVLIIDEINRANLSKVFGELLMLVESDKRDKKFALELAYSTEDDERFYVPNNLHIIGLMNTADRSLALVDYALRRRFKFFDITPGFETPEFQSFLLGRGVPEPVIAHLRVNIGQLNKAIAQDRDLGAGFLIGHSYFCDLPAEEDAEDAYNEIVEHEIIPLLREYWYEGSQAEDWRQKLLKR